MKPDITTEDSTIDAVERTEANAVPIIGANSVAFTPQIVPVKAPSKIKPKPIIYKTIFFLIYIL